MLSTRSPSVLRLAWGVVLSGLALLGGCGSGGGSAPAPGGSDTGTPQLRLVAGSTAGPGYVDGQHARFNGTRAIAFDRSGNAYIADWQNFAVRKISPAGVTTTLVAGQEAWGGTLGSISGIAVDAAGNVYLSDEGTNLIHKVTPQGATSVLAGSNVGHGFADGVAGDARFFGPTGIAVDASGNVWVADTLNSAVRKISPAGVVTTVVGAPIGQPQHSDLFTSPGGVAADADGNVFVADNYQVRRIDSSGAITTVANSGIAGTLLAGIAVDADGTLYVLGATRDVVLKITRSAQSTTLPLHFATLSPALQSSYSSPASIAVSGDGRVLIASRDGWVIYMVDGTGELTTFAGDSGQDGPISEVRDASGNPAYMPDRAQIAVNAQGNVLLAARTGLFNLTPGNVLTQIGGETRAVAFDALGNRYAAVFPDHSGIFAANVLKIDANGVAVALPGTTLDPFDTSGLLHFDGPLGVAVDSAGNVYVSERTNIIRKITPSGVATVLAGMRGMPGNADGAGSAARFDGPAALAVDKAGNVYVADTANATVRKITPDGLVTTLAGHAGEPGYVDGPPATARLGYIGSLAVDVDGSILMAQLDSFVIRRVTQAGVVSTVAGNGSLGIRLGDLPGGLGWIGGVAVGPEGIYISSGQSLLLLN